MKTIEKGSVIYTQNADLPIEERVFFRGATGVNADGNHFRPATIAELEERERYLEKLKLEYDGE